MLAVAALCILSVLIYLLSGGTLFEAKATLYMYIPDATGLASRSSVRVNGIEVGKVDSVSFSGSNEPTRVVKLILRVEQQYLAAIPPDSYAQIETDTAVGDKYVNITRGRGTAPIETNTEVAFRPQQDLMKTLDIEQFTQQMRSIEALLDQIEEGRNPAGQLLLSDLLYEQVRKEVADFETEVRQLTNPRNPVGSLLYSDEAYRRFHDPLVRLDQTIAAIQNAQNPVGKLLRDDDQYNQLASQLATLRQSIGNVKTNNFLTSDDMYNAWNRELESFLQKMDEFTISPLLTSTDMYENLTGLASELRDNVREFRQDPQKFLRIKLF